MLPFAYLHDIALQSVTARFIFFRVFNPASRHRTDNTALGWGVWIGILAGLWILAFIISEIIPFFSDMLSLICSLFSAFISSSNPSWPC